MSLKRFFRRSRWDRERLEELESYLQIEIDENIVRGMPADEARAAARRKLGNTTLIREEIYGMNTIRFLDALERDFRYALRTLRRNRAFTWIAVLTLSLGIGATTAMFSVLDGILLQPLPYPEQDRLIELVHEAPGLRINELFASPAIYFSYRDNSHTFESVALWDWDKSPSTVTGSGDPEAVQSLVVTHEFLATLGAIPVLGRGFTEADDRPGSPPTAVISYAYWQRHFGGTGGLGQTLIVDGVPRQVIGVLPQWFRFFDYSAEIFYPMQPVRSASRFPGFDGRGIARLKRGITLAEANADVRRMIPILGAEFGGGFRDDVRFGPRLRFLKDSIVGNLGDTLWVLMATIGLLMLIACANVANLLLLRTQERRQELAVRAALGAGSSHLAGLVCTESVVLGLAGGLGGLGLAYFSLPFLLSASAADLPQIMRVTVNSTVMMVAFSVSVLAVLIFALMLAIHFYFTRVRIPQALHSGGRSVTGRRYDNRIRQILVVSQVSLALVLLIGSGLMIRTFRTLQRVDPGFRDPGRVQALQLTIPLADVSDPRQANINPERTFRIQNAIQDQMATVAGVESVGFSAFNDGLPMDGDGRGGGIVIEGRTPAEEVGVEIQFISPKFFETLQTPLVAGRTFDWTDVYTGRPVALVSENFARAEWGSTRGALGKRIVVPTAPPREVVGVVGDVHHNGLSQPAPKFVSFPLLIDAPQTGIRTATYVIRSSRVGTPGFLEELQKAVWSVNRNVSLGKIQTLGVLGNVETLGDLYRRAMARTSTTLTLLAVTSTMALVLGLIGIYGVVSYSVSQRRREVGIRLALGARPGELRWFFVRHALALAGLGVLIGTVGAAGLTRLMASQLFGVGPLDPLTYAAVGIGLVAAVVFAAYLPVRRAFAIDLIETLKSE
jgi:predicted permease